MEQFIMKGGNPLVGEVTISGANSEIKLKPFLIVSLIGRSPGMMGSLLIGRQIGTGGYVSAGIIAGVAVVLCVLCVIFRKRFTGLLNKGYDKLMKM